MIRNPLLPPAALPAALLAALLANLLPGAPAVAGSAPRILLQDDGAKPAAPAQPAALAPFDCAGAEAIALAPAAWDTVIAGDTTGGATAIAGYGCRAWPEQGPEHIYRLEVAADLQLRAALSDLGAQDLDLFLLDGCDSDQCLAGANLELAAELPAGTYWLVVDGYGNAPGAAGAFTLTLETRWVGVPPQVCLEGGAVAVECAGETFELEGDLAGAADLLQSHDCSPSLLPGGESWYVLLVPGTHEVNLRAIPSLFAPALDVAVWLFDGCGAGAGCLGFADDKAGGEVETLSFENTSTEPVTVVVAVDARRAPGDGESGEFSLEFACQSKVATQVRSLGSVKALYR